MPTAKKPINKKQKQSLVSKLKLNTLKGRILATVLVFAVIGGGFAVYKSFAATNETIFTYDVARGTMIKGGSGSSYVSRSTNQVDNNKANHPVVRLTKVGDYIKIFDNTYGITIPKGQYFDICMSVKLNKGSLLNRMSYIYDVPSTSTGPIIAGYWYQVDSYRAGEYSTYCHGGGHSGYAYTTHKGPFYYILTKDNLGTATEMKIEYMEVRFNYLPGGVRP